MRTNSKKKNPTKTHTYKKEKKNTHPRHNNQPQKISRNV